MLYTFQNDDGSFDFVKVTTDIDSVLKRFNCEERFMECYREEKLDGIFELLMNLGCTPIPLMHQIALIQGISIEDSIELKNKFDEEIKGDEIPLTRYLN